MGKDTNGLFACGTLRNLVNRIGNYSTYMKTKFGVNTLLILFLVYWSQGFKSLSSLAITFYYKDILHLDPGTTQFIRTFTIVAWLIKPVYGLISDNFPILGFHRKSYLFISGVIGIISMLSILLHTNLYLSVIALLLSEFSQAFCDVIADAIMVEQSRNDEAGSSALQSYSWTVMAFGGIIGSISGGLFLEIFSPTVLIASTAICPFFLVVSACKFKESPYSSTQGIKHNCSLLYSSIKQPAVLKPLIFILILHGTSPRFTQVTTYYLKDVLHFSPTFMSSLSLISYSTLIFGSAFYHKFLKDVEYRNLICIAQVLLIGVSFIDLGLVTETYKTFGVPAWTFVVGEDVFGSTIGFTFEMLPLLVMSAKICPFGIEATFYALFTSVSNIGFAISGMFGGFLIQVLDVKTGQYELMWVLVVIKAFSYLIPLMFLSLLPDLHTQTDEIVELELLEDEKFQEL